MNRKRIRHMTVAAVSSAALISSMPVVVMASAASSAAPAETEASSVASVVSEALKAPDALTKASENTFVKDDVLKSFEGLGSVLTDRQFGIDFSLTADTSSGAESTGTESASTSGLTVTGSYAQDADAKNQSLTGTATIGGADITFQEYLDEKHIVVSCPLLFEKALSYDYTNDNPSGGLAEYKDQLAEINSGIRAVRDEITSGSLNFTVSDSYKQAVSDAVGDENIWSDGGSKDVTVNGSSVSCTGYTMKLTGEQLANVYKAAMETPLSEGGLSFRKMATFLDSISSTAGSGESSSIVSSMDEMESEQASSGATYTYYIDDQYIREIDFSINGTDAVLTFTGTDVPWHEMSCISDGETKFALSTQVNGTATTYSIAASDGSAATISYDTSDGAFALGGDGADSSLTGTFVSTGDGYKLTTSAEGVGSLEMTFKKGATVTPFDGETMELTTASEEEINSLMQTLNALLGIDSTFSSAESVESYTEDVSSTAA